MSADPPGPSRMCIGRSSLRCGLLQRVSALVRSKLATLVCSPGGLAAPSVINWSKCTRSKRRESAALCHFHRPRTLHRCCRRRVCCFAVVRKEVSISKTG